MNKLAKSYKHLTLEERREIEKLYKSGISISEIAKQLGKNYSSIYRELHRCPIGNYVAETAHAQAEDIKVQLYGNIRVINANNKPLTLDDRMIIQQMTNEGRTPREIAYKLDKSIRTITRELNKYPEGYKATIAQAAMEKRRKEGIKKGMMKTAEKKEREYKKIIKACIKLNPEADKYDIKMATGMPLECVEKYYDELHQEVTKKV